MVKLPGIGEEFAGYRIEAMLGKGGMGIVYRARHLGLDRAVALKLLPEGLTEDAAFRARFERESRMAAAMEHPNIVPIYEAGEREQLLYIVMRYVPGSDLKKLIDKEQRLPADRALALMTQAASALDAAHSKELVHRDVKPHNMLVAPETGWSQEHLYLTDFGLAKKTSSSAAITATGTFMGTVFYVAPEQIEGTRHVGPQVDVYSLGCVFYECLTGAVPFDGDSDMAIVGAHLNRPPPKASEFAGLPEALDEVIATAMAKDPSERYPSCTAMVADARSVLADAGWDVGSTSSRDVVAGRSRGDTLTAPAPVGGPADGSLGTVPTPQFRFGTPVPAPLRTSQAAGAAVGPAPRKRKRWLVPVLTFLAIVAAAVASYLLLFPTDDEPGSGDITFPARAADDMPEALPRRVDRFILKADKTDLVDATEPFLEKLGGAYQLNTSQTFVNHYVVLYGTETAAAQDFNDQITFLQSKGFRIVEEEPLKNASGGNIGDVALLRRSEPRGEEALAWTNGRLSVGARGVPGQALDFFSASSY